MKANEDFFSPKATSSLSSSPHPDHSSPCTSPKTTSSFNLVAEDKNNKWQAQVKQSSLDFSSLSSSSTKKSSNNAFFALSNDVRELVSFRDNVPATSSSSISKFLSNVRSTFYAAFPTSQVSNSTTPSESTSLTAIHITSVSTNAAVSNREVKINTKSPVVNSTLLPSSFSNMNLNFTTNKNDANQQAGKEASSSSIHESSRFVKKDSLETSLDSSKCLEDQHLNSISIPFCNFSFTDDFLQTPHEGFHFPFRVHRLTCFDEPIIKSSYSEQAVPLTITNNGPSSFSTNPSKSSASCLATSTVHSHSASLLKNRAARRASCPSFFLPSNFSEGESSAITPSLSFSSNNHAQSPPTPPPKFQQISPEHLSLASFRSSLPQLSNSEDQFYLQANFLRNSSTVYSWNIENTLDPSPYASPALLDEDEVESQIAPLFLSLSWPLSSHPSFSAFPDSSTGTSSMLSTSHSSPSLFVPSDLLGSSLHTSPPRHPSPSSLLLPPASSVHSPASPYVTTKKTKKMSKSSFSFQRFFRGLRRDEAPSTPILPPRHFWMKDETCQECYDCQLPFTTFRRKHHCRICGQIFCYRCASKTIPGEPLGFIGLVRVCNYCLDVMVRHCHPGSSTDPLLLSTPMSSPPTSPRSGSVHSPPPSLRQLRPKSFSSFMVNPFTSHSEQTPPPSSLHANTPHEDVARSSGSHVSSAVAVKEKSGKLLKQEKKPAKSPTTALSAFVVFGATGQAQVQTDASLVSSTSPTFSSLSRTKAWVSEEDTHADSPHYDQSQHSVSSLTTSTLSPLMVTPKPPSTALGLIGSPIGLTERVSFGANSTHYATSLTSSLMSSVSSDTKTQLLRPSLPPVPPCYMENNKHNLFLRRRSVMLAPLPTLCLPTSTVPLLDAIRMDQHPLRDPTCLPSMPMLHPACQRHLAELVRHQLSELRLSEAWLPVLLSLSHQAMTQFLAVHPNVRRCAVDQDGDWRRLVSFKKVPGGSPQDSFFYHGTYCKKALAHNQMPTRLQRPTVLLLNFPLEYHRIEHELMSLNPVLAQEKQHVMHLCNRLVQLNPTLVLVHGTVSRLALEYLFENQGICVAYSVGVSDLLRVARCTGTEIVASIDQLTSTPLGRCDQFQAQVYRYKDTAVPLMQFEGCPVPSGCFLLRGGSASVLRTVKQVLQFTLFATFAMYRETVFYRTLGLDPVDLPSGTSNVVTVSPGVTLVHAHSSPIHHQALHCLFFYKSEKCCDWKSMVLEFYGHGDATLDDMLAHFVSSELCPQCSLPFHTHLRRFVHGHRQVTFHATKSTAPLSQWECACGETNSFAFTLTGFSFAKYLELMFYVPLALTACGHPFFLAKHQFRIHELAVHVESSQVDLYHIHAPEMRSESLVNALEHLSLPDPTTVLLREEEISSFVAYTLLTPEYTQKLETLSKEVSDVFRASPFKDITASLLEVDEDALGDDWLLEKESNANTGHIDVEFTQGSINAVCRTYFATEFDTLRSQYAVNTYYPTSLGHCHKWETTGGKSGSHFLKTQDDRFVLKHLSRLELDLFILLAPSYFAYIHKTLFNKIPTILTKVFGVYRIAYKNSVTGKSAKSDLLVMENLWYNRSFTKVFDLKGATRHRYASAGQVLLDGNFIEMSLESPIFLNAHAHKTLLTAIYNDTLFLSKLNIMDYSLLIGIDEDVNEVVVGIIDFIRTYTWDKKLESWVKETGLLGGGKEPTIVSPKQYKTRFRDAMERYFLAVPDAKCCFGSFAANHCRDPVIL